MREVGKFMSAKVISVSSGTITLKALGKLTHPTLAAVRKTAEEILR